MIDDIAKNLPAPEMVIVGEPTDMRIINGHKGCYLFETRVKGQAGLEERSEEHTSELQSLMRISYAVFCLKKKKQSTYTTIPMSKTLTITGTRKFTSLLT